MPVFGARGQEAILVSHRMGIGIEQGGPRGKGCDQQQQGAVLKDVFYWVAGFRA